MSFMAELLVGRKIQDVMVDSEVTYIMLADGTQVTIHGMVIVEPVARCLEIRRDNNSMSVVRDAPP